MSPTDEQFPTSDATIEHESPCVADEFIASGKADGFATSGAVRTSDVTRGFGASFKASDDTGGRATSGSRDGCMTPVCGDTGNSSEEASTDCVVSVVWLFVLCSIMCIS